MLIRTVRGYDFFEVSSAMQKAIRRADAAVAGYFALELWTSGYSAYVVKDLSVEEDTICQFTGLYDKNGTDIYEGDIVLQQGYHGNKQPMVVKFECGAFIVGYHKGSSTKTTPMLLNSKCEVIGNLFDNPELLEDKK